jgi:branched-chain amino acid aminotransferase
MSRRSKYVWMDGRLVPYEQATLHFMTPSLHYGGAVFEGIRAYRGEKGVAIFRLHEHVERLSASARIFGLPPLGYSEQDVCSACHDVVAANDFGDCYLRPVVYIKDGGWNLTTVDVTLGFGIAAWEWGPYLGGEARERGVRANVSSFTRHHPNVTMTKAKVAGNYANSILAKTESMRLGFEEAIMLDPQGFVAECTGENLFLVKGGAIVTSPTATILEGITRDTLVTLARDQGLLLREQPISRDQLYAADEVFCCGTAAEVVALREIDFRPVGSGRMGPVTAKLQAAFHDAVRGRIPKFERWLYPVGAVRGSLAEAKTA